MSCPCDIGVEPHPVAKSHCFMLYDRIELCNEIEDFYTISHIDGNMLFYLPREEENSLLESVVVLEEFCKELAAITFVKYHHSS
jgi:hypothetical protein